MRHFVALFVAHRFGESAAGANPSAISAFAPAPDHRWNDDERLEERDHEPPCDRRVSENVVNHQRPGKNETVSAPIRSRMSPVRPLMGGVLLRWNVRLEKMIRYRLAQPLIKPAVVTQVRQNDLGEDKKRNYLHKHQHDRLQADVWCPTPANPRD